MRCSSIAEQASRYWIGQTAQHDGRQAHWPSWNSPPRLLMSYAAFFFDVVVSSLHQILQQILSLQACVTKLGQVPVAHHLA